MNREIMNLEPKELWSEFAEILAVPRPSYHEEPIREHLKAFAAKHGLECEQDEANNIIIRKGASAGRESYAGVVLQAHVDMVPQKNRDTEFDFLTEGINGYIDGSWVKAQGTTLGADNGIGMAAMLAVLAARELEHPPLEALFTASEEVGMDGAMGLKGGVLKGTRLLNLDSEEEGEICIGCAGGLELSASFEYEMQPTPDGEHKAMLLELKGLKGGHSGVQINEGFANANKLLFRFLRSSKIDLLLCSVDGGGLRNAIPREARAVVLVHGDDMALFMDQVAAFEQTIAKEYAPIEEGIIFSATPTEMPEEMIDEDAAACIVWSICGAPNGVQRYSATIEGLVDSSSNLARVISEPGSTKVQALLRGSFNEEKISLGESIASVFELADADVELSGAYSGWSPNVNSELLALAKSSYAELFGSEPLVKSIHAGLECGIIGTNYPEMDMISFGPTILSPHSPDERVEIATVGRFYTHLKLLLSKL